MPPDLLERFRGCVLGLALGDAYCAAYEGGPLERLAWRLLGRTRWGEARWTDDTQMTIDVIESFLEAGDIQSDYLAQKFASSYRWSRGYGLGAGRVLKLIAAGRPWQQANTAVFKQGSYGNGAAMRAPVLGLIYAQRPEAELHAAVERASIVTHAHPLAISGARLIASFVAVAARGGDPLDQLEAMGRQPQSMDAKRIDVTLQWLRSGAEVSTREVARQLGNGIGAATSCMTACYLALRFRDAPFIDLRQFVARLGGDADTICAMAGAIWGTLRGVSSLPSDWLARLEQQDRLLRLATLLYERVVQESAAPAVSADASRSHQA